ncbi:T9SS type A sorting domain-containing protein [Candidatus Amoebophilus asiaticus]|nr:T9SS type A sorting domain-containing protein [Candidatus Amoebophilus asiaticus]
MRQQALYVFIGLLFLSIPGTYAASGACTFADECLNADTIQFGFVTAADNSSCDACGHCDPTVDTFTPAVNDPDWGNNDHCDLAWANGGCGGSYNDPCGECMASITCMALISSCNGNYSICGSPENTSYAKVCLPSSTADSVLVYFSAYNISCTGGGASLQWGIYPAGSDNNCDSLVIIYPSAIGMLYCSAGTDTTDSVSIYLIPGNCYLLFFDGNAGAVCNWDFLVDTVASYSGPCIPPTLIASTTNASVDTLCDASIDITLTSASTPYLFFWSNGSNTQDQSNLCTGTYTVTILYGAGLNCDTIVSFTVSAQTTTGGIDAPTDQLNTHFNLYPNPFRDKLLVALKKVKIDQNAEFIIFDLLGRRMFYQKVDVNSLKLEINTSLFTEGIYFAVLKTDGITLAEQKIILIR